MTDQPILEVLDETSPAKKRGWLVVSLIILVPLAVIAAVLVFAAGGKDEPSIPRGEIFSYTIANGSHDRIANGETLALIPVPMYMKLGDVLEIVNEDGYTHTVGPFVIRPGETLDHQFLKKGTYVGACTVHPSGKAEIIVS